MRFDDPVRLRRMILWVMLGSLAASAGLAVVGVLDNSWEQSERMIGSGISAVVASGLLLWSGKLLESEKNRKTGLFVMGLIVIQFVLVLMALWDPLRLTGSYRSADMLAETAAVFVPVGIPAGIFFYVRQLRGGRMSGFFGMAPLAIAAGFFLAAIWSESTTHYSVLNEFIWETGWGCWFFAFAASAAVAGVGMDRRHWRWVGLLAATAALALGLHNVWSGERTAVNLLTILIALGILVPHANLISLCNLKARQRWMKWVAIAIAWVCGAIVVYSVCTETRVDVLWRMGTASGICAGCATVAVAILAAFNRRAIPAGGDGVDATEIAVVCPACRRKQNVALAGGFGEEACGGCGMILSIRVRAPRCGNCGYMLLMFKGERCPECGTLVVMPVGAVVAGNPGI